MEVDRRKRTTWESRMKSDEVKGGIKIFHGEEENSEESGDKIDLVMWRDVSKSAFVFNIGTFIIIASSYTKDINISFITVVSYLGLVYLAVIFLFKSIICRGVIGGDDTNQDYIVGEEEAVWLVKMILPYLNDFLLKFRALFCRDLATTMKLAIMLFVLARFGSTITIRKMAKLGEL
ncbi:Reticulon-like protein B21 [Camellia lanceoleosa]|uniref:Reticulon-like protein B21 n=1 Tax=Camellia lanceoleosa TaxID=1840588 RepID=A0ACC0HXI1_9ERIC|nr:Reticulon-like protein B21 [Camellia lanceoleosa]